MQLVKYCKVLRWGNVAVGAALFGLGWFYRSYFEVTCGICAVIFGGLQIYIVSITDKKETIQLKKLKSTGFFLFFPAFGVAAAGIFLLFRPYAGMPSRIAYIATLLSGVMLVCHILSLGSCLKKKLLPARFSRLVLLASISAPASLLVTLMLHITKSDEATSLSGLTVIAFGSGAVLIAVNLILVALCGYKGTLDSIKEVSNLVKSKKLLITRFVLLKDAFLVISKTSISVISFSFFMFVNALYSSGMGIARFIAIRMHTQNAKKQVKSYFYVGIIITVASICYMLYSVRLFFGGKSSSYSMNIALAIALYTFVEFGINIREAFRLRKSNALAAKALRAISFASTMLCFVLTQTAIMSFASSLDNSFANALAGLVFGGMASLIGLYVIVDSVRYKKSIN